MIKKPLKNYSCYSDIDFSDTTIEKTSLILDILFNNSPNDKRFRKYQWNYIISLYVIVYRLENDKHYSDDDIKRDINSLYNKIFKNRRHL